MLNMIEHGQEQAGPPLLIVHGLYGSARNWGVIAKRLSNEYRVITVDQRNHGDSPWFDSHTYIDMANDLIDVAHHIGSPINVVGHSMGGKAAMVMAPVDLERVHKRSDAVEQLATTVQDAALQSFFTQSLDVAGKRWKLNLDVLGRDMQHILGFPELQGSFDGPTLFLSGSQSSYVQDDGKERAKQYFPKARFMKLKDAGHWLHAEKPREFEAAVRHFVAPAQ